MKKRKTGRLCLPLTACWLVLAASFSTPARQALPGENAELLAAENHLLLEPPAQTVGAPQPAEGAQAQPQPQAPAEQQPAGAEKKPQEAESNAATSNDRVFFLLPNFLTLENAAQVPPLTAGQKFKAVARGTFDPVQFVYYGFLAGINQASNAEPGYGQGAQGFAKRYGAAFGDTAIENFVTGAVLPSVLKQDPRYFQMGKGTFRHRAWYALTRIVVIRADSGRSQFNSSEIFGSALSAGISTYSYHPEDDRKLNNLMSVWATQVSLDGVGNMVKEFWPDIRRHFRKKRAGKGNSN